MRVVYNRILPKGFFNRKGLIWGDIHEAAATRRVLFQVWNFAIIDTNDLTRQMVGILSLQRIVGEGIKR